MNDLYDFLGQGLSAYTQIRTSGNTTDQALLNQQTAALNAQAESKKSETLKNVLIYGGISLVALIITILVFKKSK